MEINPTQGALPTARPSGSQPVASKQEQTENQTQPTAATGNSEATREARAAQQVQPSDESEQSRATDESTRPEPAPTSREGVGKFIDAVV